MLSAEDREIALALLQASTGLASLLLVFIGFVYSKKAEFKTKRGDVYKHLAIAGIAPFAISLLCAWQVRAPVEN